MEAGIVEKRLRDLGYEIPEPIQPLFQSIPLVVHDGVAYVTAQISKVGGRIHPTGEVGGAIDFEQACEAARNCILHGFAWLRHGLGSLDRIDRILRMNAALAVAPGFDRMSEVVDSASDLLVAALGENGRHPRSIVGVVHLPRGAPVLIELTVAVRV